MLVVIISIVAIVIIIVLLIIIFSKPKKKCDTEVEVSNCDTNSYGWRIRWFLISGDNLLHPFQWLIDRIPGKHKFKIIRLLDNKLKYYRRQINFESESDLNDSIDGCSRINDKMSAVIPLDQPDEFKLKMDDLDRLLIDQHRHSLLTDYHSSESEFNQGCDVIKEIIEVLPQAA